MARDIVLTVSRRNVAAGVFSFGPVAVPTGVRGAALTIDTVEHVDPFPAFTWALEGSLDGGETWIGAGSASGPAVDRAGEPLWIEVVGGDFFADSGNPARQIRGTATLGGPARVALTLEVMS